MTSKLGRNVCKEVCYQLDQVVINELKNSTEDKLWNAIKNKGWYEIKHKLYNLTGIV